MLRIFLVRFAIALLFVAFGIASAKESAGWFVGAGVGYGATNIDIKYSDSSRNGLGLNFAVYNVPPDVSSKSQGINYEFVVGYKHFINDWIGFRYYANVGAQHYKDATFSNNKDKIGVIEYTANADLLINFYNGESFSLGIFGGFGVGGATFDNPLLDTYEKEWGYAKDATRYTEAIYAGMGKTYRHHFNASISAGVRISIFQSLGGSGHLMCSRGVDGRRSCRSPSQKYLEHSIEAVAKIPMMTYYATKAGEVVPTRMFAGIDWFRGVRERPGYTIKNPYKFSLRYIIAF